MVRTGDRSEGKLTAIDASRLLIEYTYDRVLDKTLPKNNRWLMSKTIWDEASNARSKLLRASKGKNAVDSKDLTKKNREVKSRMAQLITALQHG